MEGVGHSEERVPQPPRGSLKRKRQATKESNAPRVNVNTILMNDTEVEDEIPVQIGNIKEPVVALIDHGSEINLMSMEF